VAEETKTPKSTADLLRERLKGFTPVPTDSQQMSIIGAEPGLAYRIIDLSGRSDGTALARARWLGAGWTKLSDLRTVHETVVGVPLFELWVKPTEMVEAERAARLEAAITDPGRSYVQIAEACPYTAPHIKQRMSLHRAQARRARANG